MGATRNHYPSFHYPAYDLSAFAVCLDLFIITLKNGELIRYIPNDKQQFHEWLITNGVRDIRKQVNEKKVVPIAPKPGLLEFIKKYINR